MRRIARGKTPQARSAQRGRQLLVGMLDELHRLLRLEHEEPWNPLWPEQLDHQLDSMWTIALETATSPHLHEDRYCSCHIALYQAEPESLWGDRQAWT